MTQTGGIKIICQNKTAFHNYAIGEKHEAGLVLRGTEVKSLRSGKANLKDSYALFKNGELILLNAHIPPYSQGNRENHDPVRSRKLLMHRKELDKLWTSIEIKGLHLIPLKMYFKNGVAKVELGLGKSKKQYDKRETKKRRDDERQMERAFKRHQR